MNAFTNPVEAHDNSRDPLSMDNFRYIPVGKSGWNAFYGSFNVEFRDRCSTNSFLRPKDHRDVQVFTKVLQRLPSRQRVLCLTPKEFANLRKQFRYGLASIRNKDACTYFDNSIRTETSFGISRRNHASISSKMLRILLLDSAAESTLPKTRGSRFCS